MENLLKESIYRKFIYPVKISSTFPKAILNLIKPIIIRFVHLLKTNESITEETVKALIGLNLLEDKKLIEDIEDIIPGIVRHITSDKSRLNIYFSNDLILDSIQQHFFGDSEELMNLFSKEFNESQQVKVYQLVSYLTEDIMDSALVSFFPQSHVPSRYIYAVGFALFDELKEDGDNEYDQNDDDQDANSTHKNPYVCYLTPSVLYEMILHDPISLEIYLPTISQQFRAPNVLEFSSISVPKEIAGSVSDLVKFDEIVCPLLLPLVSKGATPFGKLTNNDDDDDEDDEDKTKDNSIVEKKNQLFHKLLLQLRLGDEEWLSHYQNLLLNRFPWKTFFAIGMEKAAEGFWYEDIDYFEGGNYLGLSEDDVGYIYQAKDNDDALHAQWQHIATFFRSCQILFLLADCAANSNSGSDKLSSNSYVTWVNLIAEFVSTEIFADIDSFLFTKEEEEAEEEEDSEHNRRMTTHLFFISLAHSVFMPVSHGHTTMWDIVNKYDATLADALERLRTVILNTCFFNQDMNKVSSWFTSIIGSGKVALLESFYAILFPPSHIAHDARMSENNTLVEWVKETLMPHPGCITSLVAKLLESEYLIDINQRVKLTTYCTILQAIYLLSQPKPGWKGKIRALLDHSVEGLSDFSMYSTLAHFILEKLPDYDGKKDKDSKRVHFSHQQWLEFLYTGPTILADINVNIDIESYRLPLLHTIIQAGNFPLVKYIIEKLGGDIDAIGCIDDGNDPMYVSTLNIACLYGHEEIVQYLLTKGVTVNHTSTPSPFVFAVQKNIHLNARPSKYSPRITQSLIRHGAKCEDYENSEYFDRENIFPAALMLFSTNKKKRVN
jgi:hypothetical protein